MMNRATFLALGLCLMLYGLSRATDSSPMATVGSPQQAPTAPPAPPSPQVLAAISIGNQLLLTSTAEILFFDGFESGDTSAWSNAVP